MDDKAEAEQKYCYQQECIPVGCISPAAVAVAGGGVLGGDTPQEQTSPQIPPRSRHPPGADTPWTRHPP